MIVRATAPLLACLSLAAPVFAAEPPPAADAIRQANARLEELVRARRTDDVFRVFYAEDAVLYPPGSEPVSGSEAIRALWRALASSGEVTLGLAPEDIQQHGDAAVEIGRWTLDVVPAAGGAAARDHGRYIVIWKRQPDGAWRAVRDIWNSSRTPAGP
jgi:ketosteroid isomerase-like protein